MMAVLRFVYAAGLFAGMNLLVGYVSHVVARRILPQAPLATRLAASGVTFLAIIVLLAQALSPFGLYTRETVTLAALGAALVVWRVWGSHTSIRRDASAIWSWTRSMLTSRGAIILLLVASAFVALAWRAVTRRPMGWDSLTYHLPAAAAFVQTGRLAPLAGPFAMDPYAHYPKNGEMIASWLLLPFHGDLLVGLMGVGLLMLCWITVFAFARELDVASLDASLGATALCTSPFLYSFASTQNVDIVVTVTLLASALFLIRFLYGGGGGDGLLACVAAALALGTKFTALPVGGLVLAIAGCAAVVHLERSGRRARLPAWLLAGLLGVSIVGARQYVLNASSTGNPIYPLTAGVAGHGFVHGSPYIDWLVEQMGTGDRGHDRFQFSGMFHYYPDWKTPTSAGPKYVVLIPLAGIAALFGAGRRGWAIRLAVAFAIIGFAVLELPSGGLAATSRRFWPSTARFMGAYFALFAVAGLTTLAHMKSWVAHGVRALLLGYIVWDFVAIGTHRLVEPRAAGPRRDYISAFEVDGAPKQFIEGWRFVDQDKPLTIALATGSDLHGQNRFVFPLLGSRLQNTVVYVPINRTDPPGSKAFILRENPVLADWLQGLEERQVQLVCAQGPWPIEDQWMRDNPSRFRLVFDSPDFRAYEFGGP